MKAPPARPLRADRGHVVAPLEEALAYQNTDIIDRFLGEWDVSEADALEIFDETKKWLWVNAQPDAPPIVLTEPIVIIDEMWHNFVLFTRQYTDYCRRHFGRYIHHAPTSNAERERQASLAAADPDAHRRRIVAEMRQQYEFIHDKLGEATLLKWYVEYPERYDDTFMRERHKRKPRFWAPTPALRAILKERA